MADLKKEDVYFAAALIMQNEDVPAKFIKEHNVWGAKKYVTCAILTEASLAEVTKFILWAIDELKPNDKSLYEACVTDCLVDAVDPVFEDSSSSYYY